MSSDKSLFGDAVDVDTPFIWGGFAIGEFPGNSCTRVSHFVILSALDYIVSG